MYFKTAKDSQTGTQLADFYKRGNEAWDARNELMGELMEKYPAMTGQFREPGGLVIWGGIYSLMFSEAPDSDTWINIDGNEFMPLESTNEAIEISKKIQNLPTVKHTELNAIFNYNDAHNRIGFKVGEDYFGFECDPEWGVHIPADCQEILHSEYVKL